MFEKLLQHLVQFYDDIHNEHRTTIECGILSSLQALHTTPPTESTFPTPPQAHPSPVHSSPGLPGNDHALDPLLCLHESSQFHLCQKTVEDEALFSKTCALSDGKMMENLDQQFSDHHQAPPYIGSGKLSSSPKTYGGAFDPFGTQDSFVGSPTFASGLYGCGVDKFSGTAARETRVSFSDLADMKLTSQGPGATKEPAHALDSIFSSSESTPQRNSLNVFVANFPVHWGKSDLVDLFEGIPIASVHVLPEKKGTDEAPNGGTGFVNIIRREDAEALFGLLDKKIWLIEGSALKFRLANSSPPHEAFTLNTSHRIRTIRRHPYKILDRLRAEQAIRNRQVGACDKHQIVVYKNLSPPKKPTLAVVHSSKQRNNHMTCAHMEDSSRPLNQGRTLIDDLRAYLNRSNKYNQQPTLPLPPPPPPQPLRSVCGQIPSSRRLNAESTQPLRASVPPSTPSVHLAAPLVNAAPFRSLGMVHGNLPMSDHSLLINSFPQIHGTQLGYLPQATGGGCCYVAVYQPPRTITTPGFFRAIPYPIGDENHPIAAQMLKNGWRESN